ncbi:MAG TPA: hypothetical protein VGZ22_06175 [Isosphaeraceae bacterium]|jgi:hypothetical protein|nr:hypothetical protein [Isosphaeraceae bacterium]
MKRVLALALTAAVVVGWGCGLNSYEKRLDKTLDDMRFIIRLDENLIPAPTDSKFKDFPMYLRPPKGMALSTSFVLAADVPEGQFDLTASFLGDGAEAGRNLHVLGRRKAAKKTPPKAGAPPQAEPVAQHPFNEEVIALLRGAYGESEALATPQYQTEKKRHNEFRRLIFTASNGNIIRVYLYKKEPYEAALVWDIPADRDKDAAATNARDLTLQSFAVGRRAESYFSGALTEGASSSGGEATGGSEGATPF